MKSLFLLSVLLLSVNVVYAQGRGPEADVFIEQSYESRVKSLMDEKKYEEAIKLAQEWKEKKPQEIDRADTYAYQAQMAWMESTNQAAQRYKEEQAALPEDCRGLDAQMAFWCLVDTAVDTGDISLCLLSFNPWDCMDQYKRSAPITAADCEKMGEMKDDCLKEHVNISAQ